MIQRIQSVYLLLITTLLIAVVFLPLGVFVTASGLYEFTAFSIREVGIAKVDNMPVWVLGVLSIFSAILAFVSIFKYKKRKDQIRLCNINTIIILVFYLAFAGFFYLGIYNLKAGFGLGFGLSLPLIAFILNFMTIRAIRKDEALVKSWDRIR
jgi:Domain of unknown function (DUF4293)